MDERAIIYMYKLSFLMLRFPLFVHMIWAKELEIEILTYQNHKYFVILEDIIICGPCETELKY